MMPFGPDVSLSAGPRADEFVLRPITAADARLDCEAVMDSREYLRQWEQSTWPEDDFTVADNQSDLVDLERWNSASLAFTYTILDPSESRCLGCVYILPPDATFLSRSEINPTAEGAGEWSDIDAAVCHWVRRREMGAGMDATVLTELEEWIRQERDSTASYSSRTTSSEHRRTCSSDSGSAGSSRTASPTPKGLTSAAAHRLRKRSR
jgi:hypothetical protein